MAGNRRYRKIAAVRQSGISLLSPLLFFLLLLSSCSVDLPSYVISEGKMERILYDYHLAQGMAEAKGGDVETNRYLYVQKVFEKYNITEEQFDTSMVWYSGHTSHLQKMYDRIEARLERESNAAGLNLTEVDQYSRYTAEGDTANIWRGREMMFLHGNREENLLTVVVPADSTFRPGDTFMLHTTNRFIVQDRFREGFVLMQIVYDNDSVASSTTMVNGDFDVTLTIGSDKVDPKANIRSLSCTFYYAFDEGTDPAFRLWVISKPILLRYHHEVEQLADTTSLVPDTLEADTLVPVHQAARPERISPEEFRESQDVDRKINVVQKKKVVLPAKGRPQRRTLTPTR